MGVEEKIKALEVEIQRLKKEMLTVHVLLVVMALNILWLR